MADDLLTLADEQYRAGKYTDAIRTYESARPQRSHVLYQAFIDLGIAQSLRRQGHALEARLEASPGRGRIAKQRLTSTTAELLVTLGNAEADLGSHREALAAFAKAYATDLLTRALAILEDIKKQSGRPPLS